MYMDFMFKYLSLYQGYFVRQIQFFAEQMLRSAYSSIHALVHTVQESKVQYSSPFRTVQ